MLLEAWSRRFLSRVPNVHFSQINNEDGLFVSVTMQI